MVVKKVGVQYEKNCFPKFNFLHRKKTCKFPEEQTRFLNTNVHVRMFKISTVMLKRFRCSTGSILSAIFFLFSKQTNKQNINTHQGGLESKLAATIWLPLPKDLRLMHDKSLADLDDQIQPDYIVENVLDLPAVLPQTTSFCQQRCRPVVERRGSNSYVPKTTRNREASYNRFLPDVPDLYSSSSNSCDSSSTLESH